MADTKGWYARCLLHRLLSTVLALMLFFGSSAGRAHGGWKCWLGSGEGSANQNVCFAPDAPGVDLPMRMNQQQPLRIRLVACRPPLPPAPSSSAPSPPNASVWPLLGGF
jgi:hypothetical protein